MTRARLRLLTAIVGVVCALCAALPALAQTSADQNLGNLLSGGASTNLPNPGSLFGGIAAQAQSIQNIVAGIADRLFLALVTIDIAWTVILAMLGRGEVGELFLELTKKIITFSLIYWIFVRHGLEIATVIIQSLVQVGQSALGATQGAIPAPQDPIGLIFLGVAVASPMLVEATVLGAIPDEVLGNGATNLMTGLIDVNVIGATITIGAYGFLAGTLALAIIEAYIVLSAGLLITGFLGSRWTVSIGEKYFSYAFSVGVKLLMVYVVIGIINPAAGIIAGFGAIPVVGPIAAGFMAAIIAMIAYSAPSFASSLISGSSNSSFGQSAGLFAGAIGGAFAAIQGVAGAAFSPATPGGASGAAALPPATTPQAPALTGETTRTAQGFDESAAALESGENADAFGTLQQTGVDGEVLDATALEGADQPRNVTQSTGPALVGVGATSGTRGPGGAQSTPLTRAINELAQRSSSPVGRARAASDGGVARAVGEVGSARLAGDVSSPLTPRSRASSSPPTLSGSDLGSSSLGYVAPPQDRSASLTPPPELTSPPTATDLSGSGTASDFSSSGTTDSSSSGKSDFAPSAASQRSDFASSAPAQSRPAERVQPGEADPGAYRSMSGAELRRNVNASTIPEMSRAQLTELHENPAFSELRPDQQRAASQALTEKRMQSFSGALNVVQTTLQGAANLAPKEDRGSTGAVSIRVNV